MIQLFQMLQLVIAKLLLSLILCSHAENGGTPVLLYVTQSLNISCPGIPCLTLSLYAKDQEIYFGTDTELWFLPGIHRLHSSITTEEKTNITKLALLGEMLDQNEVTITTERHASLKLVGINSVRIESLCFNDIDIFVGNSSTLVVSDLQFTAINGSAFTFENIENITGTSITISNSSDTYYSAGVVRLSNGVFTNMTVKNNSGNSILIIEESFVQFEGVSTFANNSADKESTLAITESTVIFNDIILFRSNKCKTKGGAMNIVNSNVTLCGKIELSSNSAKDGGAIQLDHSVLELEGLIDVSNNWVKKKVFSGQVFGGAINSIESSILMTGDVTYSGNYIDAKFQVGLGGAICAHRSRIILSGIVSFHHNTAEGLANYGGAILLSNSTLIATNIVLTFSNNKAQNGGAIAIFRILQIMNPLPSTSTIKVEGTSLFDANVAIFGGDLFGEYLMYIWFSGNTTLSRYRGKSPGSSQVHILYAVMADIQFHGHTEIKESFSMGIIIYFRGNVCALFSGITKFTYNAGRLAGFAVSDNASIIFLGQSYFEGNYGGLIALQDSRPSMISGEAIFLGNAPGITLSNSEIKLEGDFKCIRNGDPLYGCMTAFGSTVSINGSMLVDGNVANSGPAIYSYNSSIKMYGDYNFTNHHNIAGDGGAVFSVRSILHFDGNISFTSNSALNRGGAICVLFSELFLSGIHIYANNSANAGGAISLGMFSTIHFNDLAVTFANNRAEKGAIFHHDDILNQVDCLDDVGLPPPIEPLSVRTECFFSKPNNVYVTNTGNRASDAGNIIFGGNLERCNRENAAEAFINLFHTDDSLQNITSSPYQIVFCKNNKPMLQKILSGITINRIPGELFSVSVAGLNQLLKPISSTVRAEITESAESNFTARLGSFQNNQLTSNSCTELNYRVFTKASSINLTLYAEGPCNKLGTAAKIIKVNLRQCPNGFELVRDECICEADLLKYSTVCSVDDQTIQNSGKFWAGGLYDDNDSYVGIVSFPYCPFNYCKKEAVNFTLLNPDGQCAHYRSGTICGQCMVNYSLTLGEVQCSDCSQINPAVTFGLLLLFALVGIILAVLLMFLKMTVASGTLNGLIFYANVVDANRDIFIPQAGWLRVFISWLNLDFGFSTCFYSGMNMYGYTWLQFLFPFYIWMLIGILITISRHSAWVTKRVGSSPVAILATLILLSYAKLLRTVITVFYFANLQLPHRQTSIVWLYDGNILYLQGKHLALFIFALLFFVLLFLPYNFLLVVGPWLQNISGERVNDSKFKALVRKILIGWLEDYRIKSFVDTYTVAYNPGFQYWTGVFLMLRCVLFLIFATSAFRNSSATLMSVTTSLLIVTFLTRVFTGRIYKNWHVDILEALFLLNLGILSVATSHNMTTNGNQQLIANLSGAISLILFLLIVAHHVFKQVISTDLYETIYMKFKRKFRPVTDHDDQEAYLLSPQEDTPMTTIISVPST